MTTVIENIQQTTTDDKTLAFPLLIQAITKATRKYLRTISNLYRTINTSLIVSALTIQR